MSYHRAQRGAAGARVLPRLERRARRARERRRPPGAERPGRAADRGAHRARGGGDRPPGPSAIETALVASGLVGDRYAFVGYLPARARARERLWDEIAGWAWPVVAFESPRRLPATLASPGGGRAGAAVAVCRELTKRFEEVVRGPCGRGGERFREAPKGEVTLVDWARGRAGGRRRTCDDALEAMAELAGAGVAAAAGGRGRRAPDRGLAQRALPRALCSLFDNSRAACYAPSVSKKTTRREQAMKRVVILLPVLLALQVGVQPALAWTWPVDGPVLRPFVDRRRPLRGRAAPRRGHRRSGRSAVRAPAQRDGQLRRDRAGRRPDGHDPDGDGYSVTLVHLGTSSSPLSVGRRGRRGRNGRAERRPRARRAVRPSRHPPDGRRQRLRRSAWRSCPRARRRPQSPSPERRRAGTRAGRRAQDRSPGQGIHARARRASAARRARRSRPDSRRRPAERTAASRPARGPARGRPGLPARFRPAPRRTALRSFERRSAMGRGPAAVAPPTRRADSRRRRPPRRR